MKQLLLAGALGTVLSALGTFTSPLPAYACSAGSDFNPVAASDVIVMGTITDWQALESPPGLGMFQPIRLTISVDHTFQGSHAPVLEAVDTSSLVREQIAVGQWAGSSGACGAFNADPKGRYALMGLVRAEDGSLRTHLMHMFYIGERDQLAGARYERVSERLGSFGLILPPSLGSAGLLHQDAGSDDVSLPLAGAAAALSGALIFSTIWIASRRRSTP